MPISVLAQRAPSLFARGLRLLILLLAAAMALALVSPGLRPERVAREHADLLAGASLTGLRATLVLLAGALPLPAALYAMANGVVLLRDCRAPGATSLGPAER